MYYDVQSIKLVEAPQVTEDISCVWIIMNREQLNMTVGMLSTNIYGLTVPWKAMHKLVRSDGISVVYNCHSMQNC